MAEWPDVSEVKRVVRDFRALAMRIEGYPLGRGQTASSCAVAACQQLQPTPGAILVKVSVVLNKHGDALTELSEHPDHALQARYLIDYCLWVEMITDSLVEYAGQMLRSMAQLGDRRNKQDNGQWSDELERSFHESHNNLRTIASTYADSPAWPGDDSGQPPSDYSTSDAAFLLEFFWQVGRLPMLAHIIRTQLNKMARELAIEHYD